jgi:actin-related protein 8
MFLPSLSNTGPMKMLLVFTVYFKVLYLNPGQDFNIHFPYRRGDLYVHSGPGGSLTAVLANLETIWTWAIRHRLEIPLRDLRV